MNDDLGLNGVERFVALGPHQLTLRLGALAFTLLALAATSIAASALAPAMVLLTVPVAVACATRPDSHAGLLAMVLLLAHHAWVVDDVGSPWVLVVGLSFLGLHTCMAAATVTPPGARWTRAMTRRWGRRTAVVALVTIVVWLLALLLSDTDPAGDARLLGAVMVAIAAATAWVRRRSVD